MTMTIRRILTAKMVTTTMKRITVCWIAYNFNNNHPQQMKFTYLLHHTCHPLGKNGSIIEHNDFVVESNMLNSFHRCWYCTALSLMKAVGIDGDFGSDCKTCPMHAAF
mmetsp:Transcript_15899/g.17789  ORF Transcript_15899/g.17789 Transcript_15899/m.17789 type:complete len:108 (+) Transcript_15899:178-501(+)